MSTPASPMTSGREQIALDVSALGRWLGEKGVQVTGALTATRIGLGQSNLTYALTDEAGGRWVARRPPLGTLLSSAHDVAREHRILSALAPTDVPTPGVIGLVQDPAVCDAPVLVVEFVDGLVVDRMSVAEDLNDAQRHRSGLELAAVLAKLHTLDLADVGLADLASHQPYAQRQLKRWSRQWEASRTRELPTLDRLTGWLHDHVPTETSLSVVHGDLHIRNVILDPTTTQVRAALDWELCTLGDPLADLGTTLSYWPEPAEPSIGMFEASQLPGFATRREITSAYAAASGRDLDALTFWEVLGMWKIAIICEGVRRRALDEPANAAEGGPPPVSMVDGIVDRALDRAHA
ncbi:phosphotransferase family protein [Nocardioides albus]|uniref:Aminoglycoside phosphotransferase (APT) family kinase protein n=1 Tax=Nocardioides albus TaxID=1841 RepID=A0A7W5A4A8_9ACTN|nr:phosphotransferase family protein [Nocardioides albus]MBB3089009.1 aminoglycoside phosphotransferase (APT) family kinase protein [Nocardioides albus]GGU14841.1 acyl-CoA dehydrogenase [Nocardioides albus]